MAIAGGRHGGVPAPQRRGSGPFARKPADALTQDPGHQQSLRRAVGTLDLTALGIGAIIGTGIFVIIGEAVGKTGPSIVLSFVLAGLTCVFSALSYAELASTLPISGSAYTYSYATMGELVAWIIGWDLILEYGVAVAAVAVGWGGYVQELLKSIFGLNVPDAIAGPPGDGGTVNLPAVLLVAAVTALLCFGVRESARTNAVMVVVKIGILLTFVVIGMTAIDSHNYTPFTTHGVSGISDAAALIFFAYIGFDAVSTSGEEAERPERSLPIAIVGSLAIATVLYILVALVATGLAPSSKLSGSDAPLAAALQEGGFGAWATDLISLGALIAITSVVLTLLYGQTRIAFAMSRDGLLPRGLAKLSARRTPVILTLVFGAFIAVLAAVVPLSEIAKLVNIGTLFAFLLVNIGVIVLRRTDPDLQRGFRTPFVPVFPIIGALLCVWLMTKQDAITWVRFGGWMLVGLLIYAAYGYRKSQLRAESAPAPA
jgi:APA family basic amino acid/polyamine antiporter